jgi:hypothetical protein
MAWWLGWTTTDLVWSLWLSSFVVGYATIVWALSEPVRDALDGFRTDTAHEVSTGAKAVVLAGIVVFMLLLLAFFTFHFGMFHVVHSIFLNFFFPLAKERSGFINWALIGEVVRRYWWFVPAAALAERQAFRPRPPSTGTATVAALGERFRQRDMMVAPYRNVIRMHLLIFFFAFAHFARLENFAVYAVVYAVYFFPWRVLRKTDSAG